MTRPAAAARGRRRGHLGASRLVGAIFAMPTVLLLLFLVVYPLGVVTWHAFTRWDGISAPQWTGLRNFRILRDDPTFRLALRNNVLFALSVPVQVFVPLVLAYLFHLRVPAWRFFRGLFFLPAAVSTVVVGIVAYITFQLDGVLNALLHAFRLGALEHDWLASANTSIPLILLVVIWSNFGYNVLIYSAAMSTVDMSLEEAARIDGAGFWRVLRSVIAPNLRRTMELVLVTSTAIAFANMFTYIYVITNGGPGFDTNVAEFQVYYQWFTNGNAGYACAMALVLLIITMGLGAIQIRLLTRTSR